MQNLASTGQRLIALAQYIEQHADEPLSLELLASQAELSPFHLQRKFSALFGISPKQFQNALRVQKLKQALRQGQEVTTAIYAAGFGSNSRVYEQIDQSIGMTLSDYKNGARSLEISFALRQCRFGYLLMAATERGVCFVHFAENAATALQALHHEFPRGSLVPTPESMQAELDLWIDALEQHLDGHGPCPHLPVHLYGTAFQLSVWRFLTSLKSGQTVSYAEVAHAIERPKAFRAVANACGANKIAVLIPCHRVLRGDGSQGGYRWGAERKQQLLQLEQSLEHLAY